MSEKKPTSFRLSETAKKLLTKIAKAEHRSETQSLEVMIIEKADKLGIKPE